MATTKKSTSTTSVKATSSLGVVEKKKAASKKAATTTTKKETATKKPAVKKETAVKKTTVKKEVAPKKEVATKTTTVKKETVKTNERKTASTTNAPMKSETRSYSPNKYYRKRIKFCKLCAKGIEHVDYKDVDLLSKHLSYNLKIMSRKSTNTCTSHQRRISNAIKRARLVALIPYIKD